MFRLFNLRLRFKMFKSAKSQAVKTFTNILRDLESLDKAYEESISANRLKINQLDSQINEVKAQKEENSKFLSKFTDFLM